MDLNLVEIIDIAEESEIFKLGSDQVKKNENDTKFSLEHTCRTCLKNEHNSMNLIRIFEVDINVSTNTHNIIEELSLMKLKIKCNDGLPQQICSECMDRLTNINTFRLICEQSQTVLEKYFKTNTNEKSKFQDSKQNNSIKQPPAVNFEFINIENEQYLNVQHEIKQETIALNDDKTVAHNCNISNNDNNNNTHPNNDPCKELVTVYAIDFDNYLNNDELNKNETIAVTNDQTEIMINEKLKLNDKCKFCNRRFKTKKALSYHEENRKCNKKYLARDCSKCGKCFKNGRTFNYHKTNGKCFIHKGPKCPYCRKLFDMNLSEHIKQKHPNRPAYRCNICDKPYHVLERRDIHEKLHNLKNDKIECDICHRVIATEHGLFRHMKSFHRKHTCPHCSLELLNKKALGFHLKTHYPFNSYKCKLCEKYFLHRHDFIDHERSHTSQWTYLCDICGQAISNRKGLVSHMRKHKNGLGIVTPSYKCEICEKEFKARQTLTIHEQTKHDIYKYKKYRTRTRDLMKGTHLCKFCNKAFRYEASLKTHMKMHSDDRTYECEICGIKFKRSTHLRNHIDGVHLKKKPHACSLCDKSFLQKGELNVHMRNHTGERPFTCSYCSLGFTRLINLRLHMATHVKYLKGAL